VSAVRAFGDELKNGERALALALTHVLIHAAVQSRITLPLSPESIVAKAC
jgi:hypothetical protein